MARAFVHAPANVLTLFSYAQIIAATIFGIIAFGAVPDRWTLIGIAIIIGAGVYPQGRLVAMTGDASLHLGPGLSAPVVIDSLATYRRTAGPVLASRSTGGMDVIAIDDGGNLRWATGTTLSTIGTGWAPAVSGPQDVTLHPGARPAAVATHGGLAVIAVGSDGLLYSCGFGLAPLFFETLAPVDASVPVAASGPVALVPTPGNWLTAAAVGYDGLLRIAVRQLVEGATWSQLSAVVGDVAVSPLGGVTAVALDTTMAMLAVLPDGRPCWSQFMSGIGWLPLRAA